jgi:hypothetical protein
MPYIHTHTHAAARRLRRPPPAVICHGVVSPWSDSESLWASRAALHYRADHRGSTYVCSRRYPIATQIRLPAQNPTRMIRQQRIERRARPRRGGRHGGARRGEGRRGIGRGRCAPAPVFVSVHNQWRLPLGHDRRRQRGRLDCRHQYAFICSAASRHTNSSSAASSDEDQQQQQELGELHAHGRMPAFMRGRERDLPLVQGQLRPICLTVLRCCMLNAGATCLWHLEPRKLAGIKPSPI